MSVTSTDSKHECAVTVAKKLLDVDELNDDVIGVVQNIPRFVDFSVLYIEVCSVDDRESVECASEFQQCLNTLKWELADMLSNRIHEQDIIVEGYIGTVVRREDPLIVDNGSIEICMDRDILTTNKPKLGEEVKIKRTDKIGLGELEPVG